MSQQPKPNFNANQGQTQGNTPVSGTPTQSQASMTVPVPGNSQRPAVTSQQQQQRPAAQGGPSLDLSQLQPAQVQVLINQMNTCQQEAQRLGDTPAGKEHLFKYQRIKVLLQQYHQMRQNKAAGQANRQMAGQQSPELQQKANTAQQQQIQQVRSQQSQAAQAKLLQPKTDGGDQQLRNAQLQQNQQKQQQNNLMRAQNISPSPGTSNPQNKPVPSAGVPGVNSAGASVPPQQQQATKPNALQQYRQLQEVLPEFVKRLERIELSKKSGNLPADQLAKLIEQENTVRSRYNSYRKLKMTLEAQLKQQQQQQQQQINRASSQTSQTASPYPPQAGQAQPSPQLQQQQQVPQQQAQLQQTAIQMQGRPLSAQQPVVPSPQTQPAQINNFQMQQQQQHMLQQQQQQQKNNAGMMQNTSQQIPSQQQQQSAITAAQRKLQQQQQQQQQQLQSHTGITQAPGMPQTNQQMVAQQAITQAPNGVNHGPVNNNVKSQSPSAPITNVNAAARPNMNTQGPISSSNTAVFKSSIPAPVVSQTVTAKPPTAVAPAASRPSLSAGNAIGAPSLTTPALLKVTPYEMQGDRVLSKRKLSELVKTVGVDEGDGETAIDGDVEELLLDLADEFVTNVTGFACRLAKHRKSENLQSKDIQLHLEKNYNIRIPGYASDDIRSVRKWVSNSNHATRLQGIEISKSVEQNK